MASWNDDYERCYYPRPIDRGEVVAGVVIVLLSIAIVVWACITNPALVN